MNIEEKILYELKCMRIDMAQAEMVKLGLFPVDKYKAAIVDRINMLSNEMNDLFLNSCEEVMEHVDDGSMIEYCDSQTLPLP